MRVITRQIRPGDDLILRCGLIESFIIIINLVLTLPPTKRVKVSLDYCSNKEKLTI